jgi:NADH-quinone oxidoreductase subunit J
MPHGTLPLSYTFFFYVFGMIAVVSAILFVTRKSPVAAALWLVNTMFGLAALYVMLDAQFIGAIQVLVYAGAIMVVFLFVIMLLNLGHPSEIGDMRGLWPKLIAIAFGIALLAEVFTVMRGRTIPTLTLPQGYAATQIMRTGAVAPISSELFTRYLLAFEITSVLLLAAVIGAVILAKRKDDAR